MPVNGHQPFLSSAYEFSGLLFSTRFPRCLKLKLFYGIPPPALPVVSEANKYPPAKPGVFLMRAKPYVTSHASCGVGTACHLHRPFYPHRYKSVTFSFSYSCHPLYLHFFLLSNYISTAIFTSISQLAKLFLPLHS